MLSGWAVMKNKNSILYFYITVGQMLIIFKKYSRKKASTWTHVLTINTDLMLYWLMFILFIQIFS